MEVDRVLEALTVASAPTAASQSFADAGASSSARGRASDSASTSKSGLLCDLLMRERVMEE